MKGEIGIREVVYLIIGIFIVILVLLFLGLFTEIKDGLVRFFSGNDLLESFK